jgi:hypothetical protein
VRARLTKHYVFGHAIKGTRQIHVKISAKGDATAYSADFPTVFAVNLDWRTSSAVDFSLKLNFFVSSAVPMADVLASHFAIRDKYINLEKPPASAFVFVSRLFRADWLLEVESIAVKP